MTIHRLARLAVLMGGALLAAMLPGCGEGRNSAPTLPFADNARSDDAPAVNGEVVPGAAFDPESAADEPPPRATTPATLAEAMSVVDLRDLTPSEGITDVELGIATATYNVRKSIADALEDARRKLITMGFHEDPRHGVAYVSPELAQATFSKGDFRVSLAVTPKFDDVKASNVRLQNLGNVDSRTLPALPDARVLTGGPTLTTYITPDGAAATADAARKLLTDAGWQEYGPVSAPTLVNPDQRTLTFRQNAINLTALIGTAPTLEEQTTLQYGMSLLSHELPAAPEAVEIKYDDYQPLLTYNSAQPVAEIADFYRQELAANGWQGKSEVTNDNEKRLVLIFEHAVQAASMTVELQQSDDETATVQVRQAPLAPTPERDASPADRESVGSEMPAAPAASTVEPLILTRQDLPIPPGARKLSFDELVGDVTYSSELSIANLVEFSKEMLAAAGWTKSEFGVETENAAAIEFHKANSQLDLRMSSSGDGTNVTISGRAIDWQLEDLSDMPGTEAP